MKLKIRHKELCKWFALTSKIFSYPERRQMLTNEEECKRIDCKINWMDLLALEP